MKYEEIFVGVSYACGPAKALEADFPQVRKVTVTLKGITREGVISAKGRFIGVKIIGDEVISDQLKATQFLAEWNEFERIQNEKNQGMQERLRQRELRQQHLDERVKGVMARLRGLGMSHYVQRNCPRSDVTVEVEVLEKLLDRCDLLASGATPTLY